MFLGLLGLRDNRLPGPTEWGQWQGPSWVNWSKARSLWPRLPPRTPIDRFNGVLLEGSGARCVRDRRPGAGGAGEWCVVELVVPAVVSQVMSFMFRISLRISLWYHNVMGDPVEVVQRTCRFPG